MPSTSKDDRDLLQQYIAHSSETAFETLVRRHLGMVYAAAFRRCNDAELAKDISQAVFIIFAQKAAKLRPSVVIAGWLYQTASLAARRAMRDKIRRFHHLREAATMNVTDSTDETWARLVPHLDSVIAGLGEADRNAIVLRFLQGRSFNDVGVILGTSEDAAKKRVSRALEKMRSAFMRRGLSLSVAGLTTALVPRSATAAPVEFARAVAHVGLAAGAGAPKAGAIAAAVLRDALVMRLKWIAGFSVATLLLALLLAAHWTGRSTAGPSAQSAAPSAAVARAGAENFGTPAKKPDSNLDATNHHHFVLRVVADEDDSPLPNAMVHAVFGWISQEHRRFSTDANGLLSIALPDKPISYMGFWIVSPGRVPMTVTWESGIDLAALQPDFVERLPRAQTVAGQIVDELGNPVGGASVHFQSEGSTWNTRDYPDYEGPVWLPQNEQLPPVLSDAAGEWSANVITPQAKNLYGYVACANFAVSEFGHTSPGGEAPPSTNMLLVIKHGTNITGTVHDGEGNPIVGVTVMLRSVFGWPPVWTNTDSAGEFDIPNVIPAFYKLNASANGFDPVDSLQIGDASTNLDIVLNERHAGKDVRVAGAGILEALNRQKSIHIHGSVTDSSSGRAIPEFRILLGQGHNASYVVNTSLLLEGRSGRFSFDLRTNLAAHFDPPGSSARLEFKAAGYVNWIIYLDAASDDLTLNVDLEPAIDICGVAYLPDGQPANGAKVYFRGEHFRFSVFDDLFLSRIEYPFPVETRASSDGSFRIPKIDGVDYVDIVHPAGWASIPIDNPYGSSILLQPWARISGEVHSAAEPAEGFRVTITDPGDEPDRIAFSFSTQTDVDGRFKDLKAPAGSVQVIVSATAPNTNRLTQTVNVQPGQNYILKFNWP